MPFEWASWLVRSFFSNNRKIDIENAAKALDSLNSGIEVFLECSNVVSGLNILSARKCMVLRSNLLFAPHLVQGSNRYERKNKTESGASWDAKPEKM